MFNGILQHLICMKLNLTTLYHICKQLMINLYLYCTHDSALSKNKLKKFPSASFINCRSLLYLWVLFVWNTKSLNVFFSLIFLSYLNVHVYFCWQVSWSEWNWQSYGSKHATLLWKWLCTCSSVGFLKPVFYKAYHAI